MDKIFSRRKLRFKVLKWNKEEKEKTKHKNKKIAFIVIIIAITTTYVIINRINPVFNAICAEKTKAIATEITNIQANNTFKNINYEDLVEIVKEDRKYKYAKD